MYMLTSINLNDHHYYYLLQCCISGTECKYYCCYKVYFISISFHLVNANQIVFIGTENSGPLCYLEL